MEKPETDKQYLGDVDGLTAMGNALREMVNELTGKTTDVDEFIIHFVNITFLPVRDAIDRQTAVLERIAMSLEKMQEPE